MNDRIHVGHHLLNGIRRTGTVFSRFNICSCRPGFTQRLLQRRKLLDSARIPATAHSMVNLVLLSQSLPREGRQTGIPILVFTYRLCNDFGVDNLIDGINHQTGCSIIPIHNLLGGKKSLGSKKRLGRGGENGVGSGTLNSVGILLDSLSVKQNGIRAHGKTELQDSAGRGGIVLRNGNGVGRIQRAQIKFLDSTFRRSGRRVHIRISAGYARIIRNKNGILNAQEVVPLLHIGGRHLGLRSIGSDAKNKVGGYILGFTVFGESLFSLAGGQSEQKENRNQSGEIRIVHRI